ncbi:MAG: hypothetical protein II336_18050 [Loktanella sp.]|nr:hypothetical protein [Loktanella sp.]
MTLIEQIKADREAGTAGPWAVDDPSEEWPAAIEAPSGQEVLSGCGCCGSPNLSGVDARRIARVPDMEAGLLAADELARECERIAPIVAEVTRDAQLGGPYGVMSDNKFSEKLAAYRRAVEGGGE